MIGTPNDAVFIAAGSPYRISYPAAIGDECLTLRFSSEALAQMLPRAVPRHGCSPAFASHVLLPPQVMLTRGLLWQCGGGKPRDPLEIEELGVDVLVAAMSALCLDDRVARRGQTVVWHNVDSTTHRVVLADQLIDTGNLAPGAFSAPMAVRAPGGYFCSIHPDMVGSVSR